VTAPEAGAPPPGAPPPVVRIVAAPASTAALRSLALLGATLVEALRARGYRTVTAERRPAGGLSVMLASGGRIGVERAVAAAALGGFVAGIDPRADLVLALGFDEAADAALPSIEVTGGEPAGTAGGGLAGRLATIGATELNASLQSGGRSRLVDDLAALLDARLLGGGDAAASEAAPADGGLPGVGLLGRLRRLARRG